MIQIDIDGFSGPLDILCHMVENREIEAFKISVGHVIKVYGQYLSQNGKVSIEVIADFIVQAAQLVLGKTMALMPQFDEPCDEVEEDFDDQEVTDLREVLARYMPYRKAISKLLTMKDDCDKRAFRKPLPIPVCYDLGDLYSLASLWWSTIKARKEEIAREEEFFDSPLEGVPEAIPDEVHVERKMEVILEKLEVRPEISFCELVGPMGISDIVVNLLALLELSRRNRVSLVQKERFGDVLIFRKID